jgi:hypothetical protein
MTPEERKRAELLAEIAGEFAAFAEMSRAGTVRQMLSSGAGSINDPAARKKRHREKKQKGIGVVKRVCPGCGVEFPSTDGGHGGARLVFDEDEGPREYCSEKCQKRAEMRRYRERQAAKAA